MSKPALSARLRAALGIEGGARLEHEADKGENQGGAITVIVRVDDVDRRFRDAIKAGAEPIEAPSGTGADRIARLRDRATGTTVVVRNSS